MKTDINIYTEELNQAIKTWGGKHINTIEAMYNLGWVYKEASKYNDAIKILEKALVISQIRYGNDNLTLRISACLGICYAFTNNILALDLFKIGVNISKVKYGDQHPEFILYKNNLAAYYRDTGDFKISEKLYKETIDTGLKILGKYDEAYLIYLNGYGTLCLKQKYYQKAKNIFSEALKLREETLGSTHKDTILTKNNLALANKHLNKKG